MTKLLDVFLNKQRAEGISLRLSVYYACFNWRFQHFTCSAASRNQLS